MGNQGLDISQQDDDEEEATAAGEGDVRLGQEEGSGGQGLVLDLIKLEQEFVEELEGHFLHQNAIPFTVAFTAVALLVFFFPSILYSIRRDTNNANKKRH
jgi:hypothetical protein